MIRAVCHAWPAMRQARGPPSVFLVAPVPRILAAPKTLTIFVLRSATSNRFTVLKWDHDPNMQCHCSDRRNFHLCISSVVHSYSRAGLHIVRLDHVAIASRTQGQFVGHFPPCPSVPVEENAGTWAAAHEHTIAILCPECVDVVGISSAAPPYHVCQ